MNPGVYGAFGDTEDFCNLLDRQALHVAEPDYCFVFGSQVLDRVLELVAHVAAPLCWTPSSGRVCINAEPPKGFIDRLPPLALPEKRVAFVHGNPRQPCPKTGSRLISLDIRQGSDEGLLRRVGGFVGFGYDGQTETVDTAVVLPYHRFRKRLGTRVGLYEGVNVRVRIVHRANLLLNRVSRRKASFPDTRKRQRRSARQRSNISGNPFGISSRMEHVGSRAGDQGQGSS